MCDHLKHVFETRTPAGLRDWVKKPPRKRVARLGVMATLVMPTQKTKRERDTSTAEGDVAVSVSGSKKKRVEETE